ncbi:MAG: hypothetical protein U1E65_05455 [Myxococcota bacterium]
MRRRSARSTTLQLGLVLAIGVPTLAFTQPFGALAQRPAVLAALALFTLISLWRQAARLEGELRAGSLELVSALADQRPPRPGLRRYRPSRGDSWSRWRWWCRRGAAVDRSPGELDLRGRTRATVVAIVRAGEAVVADAKRRCELGISWRWSGRAGRWRR